MFAKLVENLVHLEGSKHRLYEGGRLDGAAFDAELLFRRVEDVVPEPRLEVRLHLRQIQVRTRAAFEKLFRVVEEEQAEVEDRARYGLAVDDDVLLVEVPTTRPHDEHRGALVQEIVLAALLEADRAATGIAQVQLAIDHVVPGRTVRVLEVRHEGGGAGIQRIDHHLAVGGPGDLDTPVEKF